jgi:hypothetical protein
LSGFALYVVNNDSSHFFVRHKCLRSLVTSTCHIEDESLKNLGLCTQLETLDVGHLSFDSMKGIAEMSQLNDLELNMLFLTSNNFVEIFRGNF